MKKFWAIVLVVLTMVCFSTIICAVASAESSPTAYSSENTKTKASFQKVEEMTDCEAIKFYCKTVYEYIGKSRIKGYYLTEDEYNYLIDNDFFVDIYDDRYIQKLDTKTGELMNCYFPIIFEGKNGIEIWYTDDEGKLRAKALEGRLTNDCIWYEFGDVHHTLDKAEYVLMQDAFYETVYNNQTGVISVWKFGMEARQYFIPKRSIYAGFSSNEGYIFRNGSDVYAVSDDSYDANEYAVRDYPSDTKVHAVRVIAHDVEFVISADYEAHDPEEFSQPLFLMKDGTVKCYCPFYSKEGTPVDDKSNLIDIYFEGGFNI